MESVPSDEKINETLIYKEDLTKGIFPEVYKAINKNLFKEDYFQTFKNTNNPLIKEFFIFNIGYLVRSDVFS